MSVKPVFQVAKPAKPKRRAKRQTGPDPVLDRYGKEIPEHRIHRIPRSTFAKDMKAAMRAQEKRKEEKELVEDLARRIPEERRDLIRLAAAKGQNLNTLFKERFGLKPTDDERLLYREHKLHASGLKAPPTKADWWRGLDPYRSRDD